MSTPKETELPPSTSAGDNPANNMVPRGPKQKAELKKGADLHVGGDNFEFGAAMKLNDLRNGAPEQIQSMLVRATLAPIYHWVTLEGLAPQYHSRAVAGYIRNHMAYINLHKPTGWSAATVRKHAIVLGAMRAAAAGAYQLTAGDMIAGEVTPGYLIADLDANGNITYAIKKETDDPIKEELRAVLEFTPEEIAAISQLTLCGAAVIPMQGYSLIMCGHHYLSDAATQSRKSYANVEKAHWHTSDVGAFFSADLEAVQSLAWHKSTHPVSITLKENMAYDKDMPDRLKNAGIPTAAARLPAKESELRTANSYLTLFRTVKPLFEMYGGKLNYVGFEALAEEVIRFPRTGEVNVTNELIFEEDRRRMKTRKEALRVLAEAIQRNSDRAALCYGFYCALSDSTSMMTGTTTPDTLKTSYSLVKLRNQSHASYVGGSEMFKDYQAARNKLRSEGKYAAPELDIV